MKNQDLNRNKKTFHNTTGEFPKVLPVIEIIRIYIGL